MDERAHVLKQALTLITGDRAKEYGDAETNFNRIASFWTTFLGDKLREPITGNQVALMMALLKIARASTAPGHADSYIDIAGYSALAYEVGYPVKIPKNDKPVKINKISDNLGYFDE